MTKTVLIFPAGMPMSLVYLKRAQDEGCAIIGASSLAHDPVRAEYPTWLQLPYVHHPGFDEALAIAIQTHAITDIYSPHPVVWDYLQRVLKNRTPAVALVNASPVQTELEVFRSAKHRALDVLQRPLSLATTTPPEPDRDLMQIASLYRHVEGIPGMCDHEKLRALYEIARSCPEGDVVEIGTWWGKSAFVLLRLAGQFGIGRLLCVDPWTDAGLISDDAHTSVAATFSHVSAQEAFEVFLLNLLPYANGDINFLRMPSVQASTYYQANSEIHSSEFGRVRYLGRISLLHIDGNHSYENAKADVAAWCDLVVPGGWVVIDDYNWPFGDGPQRVGNEYLADNYERISTAFVMGGALFVQLAQ